MKGERNFTAKDILVPVVVLVLICVAESGLLALTNAVTVERIAAIDEENKNNAMALVMPDAASFGEESVDGDVAYSPALDASCNTVGYVFTTSVKGYGGDIDVMAGIDTEGVITNATILAADDETPGLGQNTRKPAFIGQFAGKSGSLTVVKTTPGDNEIQAVTSATISSTAVTKAVNGCLEYFSENLREVN